MSTYQHDAASTESNLLRRVLACLSNNAELIARARAEVAEELIDEPRERRDPPEQREQRWVDSAHEKQRRAMEMERRAIEMERRAMEDEIQRRQAKLDRARAVLQKQQNDFLAKIQEQNSFRPALQYQSPYYRSRQKQPKL